MSKTGVLIAAMLMMLIAIGPVGVTLEGQAPPSEILRRVKTRVQPDYPELARRMNIAGTVKVEVVVAANGSVKDAKVIGGHPVLANAALEAVKKWRFEPAALESSGVVDFKFGSRN